MMRLASLFITPLAAALLNAGHAVAQVRVDQPAPWEAPRVASPKPVASGAESPVRTLLTTDMAMQKARIIDVTATGVAWAPPTLRAAVIDANALTRTGWNSIVALLPPTNSEAVAAPSASAGDEDGIRIRVWLVDGQRVIGTLAGQRAGLDANTGAPQSPHEKPLTLLADNVGLVTIQLDSISRIEFVAATGGGGTGKSAASDANEDSVVLANGDHLVGFVEEITAAGVTVTTGSHGTKDGGEGATVRAPIDSVRVIQLANPLTSAAGMMLWTADGGAWRIRSIASDSAGRFAAPLANSGVAAAAAGAGTNAVLQISGALEDIVALSTDASRTTALASAAMTGFGPGPGRRTAAAPQVIGSLPAALDAPAILLGGPMWVEWELPDGASRFIATAELPYESLVWGACTVVVEVVPGQRGAQAARTVWSGPLSGAAARASLNAALADRTHPPERKSRLRITVIAGEHGPVLDRLILRNAIILSTPAAAAPGA